MICGRRKRECCTRGEGGGRTSAGRPCWYLPSVCRTLATSASGQAAAPPPETPGPFSDLTPAEPARTPPGCRARGLPRPRNGNSATPTGRARKFSSQGIHRPVDRFQRKVDSFNKQQNRRTAPVVACAHEGNHHVALCAAARPLGFYPVALFLIGRRNFERNGGGLDQIAAANKSPGRQKDTSYDLLAGSVSPTPPSQRALDAKNINARRNIWPANSKTAI